MVSFLPTEDKGEKGPYSGGPYPLGPPRVSRACMMPATQALEALGLLKQ